MRPDTWTMIIGSIMAAVFLQLAGYADVIEYDMAVKGSIYDTGSWTGGVIPGSNDVALIRNTVTGETVTFTFTNDLAWGGIYIDAPVSKDLTVNLDGTGTLLLGSEGIQTSTANIKTVNLSVQVSLTADQTWMFGSGALNRTTGDTYLNDYTLTVDGTVKKEIKKSLTGPGKLLMNGSYLVFTDNNYAEDVDLVFDMKNVNSFVDFNDMYFSQLAKSLTVESDGAFRIYSNSEWRFTTNTLGSAITLNDGLFRFTMERTRTPKMVFSASGLQREKGMFMFRGTELGMSPVSSTETQAVNIVFDSVPELLGDPVGSGSSMPVMAATVVDTTAGGSGEGFGTYDAASGVRLLDPAAEYTSSIVDGQSSLDNVLYSNTDQGPMVTTLMAPLTTINSLTMTEAGGAGLCGITVTSAPDATLKINSGMIYANQSMTSTPTTDDALVLQVPNLDFNGKDGLIFLRETKYTSNGYCNAPLRFRSSPTNTSENGISFYSLNSGAYVYFDGGQTNTYTGPVTFGGRLYARLEKSIPNNAILGTLIVNGATCQFDNELADDADILLKAGSVLIKSGASNSGNSGNEVYRDLTIYDGTYTHGGGGGGATTLRNAALFGGKMNQARGTLTTITGDMMLAGCNLTLYSNTDSNRSGVKVVVGGTMTISNTVSLTQYVPISLGYSYYRNPAYVSLTNKLAVYGNSVNPNSVIVTRSYSADSRTMLGEFRLNDAVEFEIDDGAADSDFEVDATIADNGSTVGMLVKTGEGTLLLTAATNSLSGGMDINEGRLMLNGTTLSDVAVAAGATLAGTGGVSVASGTALTVDAGGIVSPGVTEAIGTLSVKGDVSFADSSLLAIDVASAGADRLVVDGAVTGGPVTVNVAGVTSDDKLIMTATAGISANFTVNLSGRRLIKRAGDSELWLVRSRGTVLLVH